MKLISIPTIAKEMGKDISQVRKDIKAFEFDLYETITADGKNCTAITEKDFKILKSDPSYSYTVHQKLPAGGVTLDQITADYEMDKSGMQRKIKRLGIVMEKAYVKGSKYPIRFLSKEQHSKLLIKEPPKVVAA